MLRTARARTVFIVKWLLVQLAARGQSNLNRMAIMQNTPAITARLGLALLVFLACFVQMSLSIPSFPVGGLDPSWTLAMNYAVANGLSIGKQIVFTFGPYSSAYTNSYNPDIFHLTTIAYSIIAFSVSASIYNSDQKHVWIIVLLIVIMPSIANSRDTFFIFCAFMNCAVTLYFCLAQTVNRRSMIVSAILGAPIYALLPLIKGSFLVASVAFYLIIMSSLIFSRSFIGATIFSIVVFIFTLILWIIAGQNIEGIIQYYNSMMPIISGYTDAMSLYFGLVSIIVFIIGCAIVTATLFIRDFNREYILTFSLLIASYVVFLFISFKAGFVRQDGHVVAAGTALILAGSTLIAFRAPWSQCIGVRSSASNVTSVIVIGIGFLVNSAYVPVSSLFNLNNGVGQIQSSLLGLGNLFDQENWKAQYVAGLAAIGFDYSSDEIVGTADLYNYELSHLFSAGIKWSPRPVFQSYSAYTPQLISMNAEHLVAKDAPDNVFFTLQTIDGHLPTVDDGASWPALIANYDAAALRGDFAHFVRRPNAFPLSAEVILNGSWNLGDRIELPLTTDLYFAKIAFAETIAGRFMKLFLKSTPTFIDLFYPDGTSATYRLPAGMASSGFYISPMPLTTREVVMLLQGEVAYLSRDRPVSFSLHGAELANFLWKDTVDVVLERHAVAQKGLPDGVRTQRVNDPLIGQTREKACLGVLDTINGGGVPPPGQRSLAVGDALMIKGWLYGEREGAAIPSQVYLQLVSSGNVISTFLMNRTARDDVKIHFNNPNLPDLGYEAAVTVPKNIDTVQVLYRDGEAITHCVNLNFSVLHTDDN